ncbi:MAG: kynureninase [Bacteroidia bacterium]
MHPLSLEYARHLDQQDPLRVWRGRFHLPLQADGSPCIYLTGNSLGCQPHSTRAYVEAELDDWQRMGVEGHFHARHPWLPYHELLAESTARLTGALPEEVVTMNSLTVNLHLMMASFYRPAPGRHKILIEADAFPSDIYAVRSQLAWHGYDPVADLVMLHPRPGTYTVGTADIEAVLAEAGDTIALVLIGGVNYYTGQVFDMARIARAAHAAGCMVGFDLAHAIGNIPLHLHDWEADFACWCTYKYLNSGPGGVAGAFVHARHHNRTDLPRLAGWWGHDKATRFRMGPDFVPIPTAEGWQLSNAPILAMAALRASLDIFDEVGMAALRTKSLQLTDYLLRLLDERVARADLAVITPRDPAQRGCQLSLHAGPGGRALFDRLSARGVICDWREPDVIRAAPVPLYNSFEDLWHFADILAGS